MISLVSLLLCSLCGPAERKRKKGEESFRKPWILFISSYMVCEILRPAAKKKEKGGKGEIPKKKGREEEAAYLSSAV